MLCAMHVSTGYAPGFITGEVIEQDPPAGTPHPSGSAVNLVLQELPHSKVQEPPVGIGSMSYV